MERLASDHGCPVCHEKRPPGPHSILPSAPSWQDIARRYRKDPRAEERLAAIVLAGSDPQHRHWSGQAQFDRMYSNDIAVTPDEARELVRWILSSR